MPKPIWKGHISFGLVNIPVVLHSAEQNSDIRFRLIDSRNGSRIHYERVNDETGKEVPWNFVVHGYEYEKGDFVLLSKEDFNQVAQEQLNAIEIEEFIPSKELESIYFERPYYVFPDGKNSHKGYALLREILQKSHKVGIAKIMIRTHQHIAAIIPHGKAIVINLLRYPQEIRKAVEGDLPSDDLKDYKVSKKEMDIAMQLVDAMTVHWDPKRYHDEYREALMKWIEKKAASGQKGPAKRVRGRSEKETQRKAKVVDFMELLKNSVKEKARKKKSSKPKIKQAKTVHKFPKKKTKRS